jgi:putative DNA primase/helicase
VRRATAEYRAEQDLLAAFLEDCCWQSPTAWVAKQALYRTYVPWCEARGERPESQRALSRCLKERGMADGRGGANSEHRWYGLGLRDTDVTDVTDPVFRLNETFPAS